MARQKKDTQVHFKITQEADRMLRETAERLGLSLTSVVEIAIRDMHRRTVLEQKNPASDPQNRNS